MTDLFIADRTQTIKDTEKHPIKEGMIEKLDEMLTANGIQHFFTLPIDATDGIANNDDDCLNLFYDSKDETVFFLTYALWTKMYRGTDDKTIKKAMQKFVA